MLIHPWDEPLSGDDPVEFVRRTGFGHLVAPGRREVPVVVPTQYVVSAAASGGAAFPDVLLHLARPNPIWSALAESSTVVLSVAGEWAYVPSAWKAIGDEDPALGIPTTYYAAVQLVADAVILDDPGAKLDVLRAQLSELEPDGGAADPSVHDRKLVGIRGLRLSVREVKAKFKYGGNVDAAHRSSIAERLASRAGPGDAAARAHVLRSLARG
ncbi:MAG: transcriptional regulator [Frankiaceae bacterium]|nr:transcriptional regulator [Frankiaceae bacterium]